MATTAIIVTMATKEMMLAREKAMFLLARTYEKSARPSASFTADHKPKIGLGLKAASTNTGTENKIGHIARVALCPPRHIQTATSANRTKSLNHTHACVHSTSTSWVRSFKNHRICKGAVSTKNARRNSSLREDRRWKIEYRKTRGIDIIWKVRLNRAFPKKGNPSAENI